MYVRITLFFSRARAREREALGGLIVTKTRNDSRDNLARFRRVRVNLAALDDRARARVLLLINTAVFRNCDSLSEELIIINYEI